MDTKSQTSRPPEADVATKLVRSRSRKGTSRRGFLALAATAAVCSGCAATETPAASTGGEARNYQWRNVAIRGGGFVTGIIPHPRRPGLVYARTDVGGAYRRNSYDAAWTPITDWIGRKDSNLSGIDSLAVDPTDARRVYLAAGMYTQWWAPNGAILCSEDMGTTWRRSPLPIKLGGNEPGRFNGERLMVDPNFPARLLFGSRSDGLWLTDNHGRAWRRIKSFPTAGDGTGIGLVCVVFDAQGGAPGTPTPRVYVAVSTHQESLFVSHNAGRTWAPVDGQPTGLRPNHAVLAKDGNMYISYGLEPGPNSMTDGAVWCLDTRQGTWKNITPVRPSGHDSFGYGTMTLDAHHPRTIMTSSFCRWARGDSLFRSTDGGANWTSISPGHDGLWTDGGAPWIKWHRNTVGATNWIGSLQIDPHEPGTAMYTTGCGLFTTHNLRAADRGGVADWSFDCRGLEETVVNKLLSPPQGPHLLSTVYDIDGFRHDDLRQSPTQGMFNPSFGSNTDIDFAQLKPGYVVRVFGGQNSHGAISVDGGRTWKMFASGAPGDGGGHIAVCAMARSVVCTPDRALPHVSRNGGQTWNRCENLPAGTEISSDRSVAGRFYGVNRGQSRLWISHDGGERFSRVGAVPRDLLELKNPPGLPGHLWLAGNSGLYFSANAGAKFRRIAGVNQAYNIGFGMAAPDGRYPAVFIVGIVAGQYGFYRSDNQGKDWRRINDDRQQFFYINAIAGDPRVFGRVYIGTSGRGIIYGDLV